MAAQLDTQLWKFTEQQMSFLSAMLETHLLDLTDSHLELESIYTVP